MTAAIRPALLPVLPCADRLAANVTKDVLEEVRQVKQVMGRLTGRVQRVKTELEVGAGGAGLPGCVWLLSMLRRTARQARPCACRAAPALLSTCHAMPCHVVPCRAVPCRCTAMPCHAMPCHAHGSAVTTSGLLPVPLAVLLWHRRS